MVLTKLIVKCNYTMSLEKLDEKWYQFMNFNKMNILKIYAESIECKKEFKYIFRSSENIMQDRQLSGRKVLVDDIQFCAKRGTTSTQYAVFALLSTYYLLNMM